MSRDPGTSASERAGYETRDAQLRPLLVFLAALGLVMILGMAISAWLERAFARPPAEPHPMEAYQLPEKGPLLQATPGAEARSSKEEEARRLSTYGWIDRENGIVRVPIDVAIERVLARGLPVRTPQSPPPAADTGKAAGAGGSPEDGR